MSIAKQCRQYIAQRPAISSGLAKGVVNRSALARQIANELGIGGEENFDAILAGVRRATERIKPSGESGERILQLLRKSRVEVKSKIGVAVLSGKASFSALSKLFAELAEKEEPLHFVHGSKTITLIVSQEWLEKIKRQFAQHIVKSSSGLVEVIIKSDREIEKTPGVLDFVYGRLAEHGVNILETASSWTDTILVIEEKDLQKAMEALRF